MWMLEIRSRSSGRVKMLLTTEPSFQPPTPSEVSWALSCLSIKYLHHGDQHLVGSAKEWWWWIHFVLFTFMDVCLHVCVCTTTVPSTQGSQGYPWKWHYRWPWDTMWVLRTELRSSAGAEMPELLTQSHLSSSKGLFLILSMFLFQYSTKFIN